MFSFFGEVKGELAQVTWPTRPEVIRLTLMVVAISVLVGVYLGTSDFIFTKLIELLVA